MALDDCSSRIQDAMDTLWYHQNILFSEPPGLSLQSLLARTDGTSITPLPKMNIPSKSSDENKNEQAGYKAKRPPRLDIIVGLQLQPPLPGKVRSYPSSPCLDAGPRCRRKRASKKIRSYKSFSELENYELKGFMDMGFVFHTEKLSSHILSIVPGLQRLNKKDNGEPDNGEVGDERVRRPYLSEAWLIKRPDSPLLNLRMLLKSPDHGADMKRHLQFWAREVASLVQQES